MEYFEFIETDVFSKARAELLTDLEFSELQQALVNNPKVGPVMVGVGGCRKLRWQRGDNAKGKSGGIRIIYYYATRDGKIYLVLAYAKGKKDSLSAQEKAILRKIIEKMEESL